MELGSKMELGNICKRILESQKVEIKKKLIRNNQKKMKNIFQKLKMTVLFKLDTNLYQKLKKKN